MRKLKPKYSFELIMLSSTFGLPFFTNYNIHNV